MVEKEQKKATFRAYTFILVGIFFMTTIEITYKLIQDYGTVPPALANFFRMSLSAFVILSYIAASGGISRFIQFLKLYPKYYITASIVGIFGGVLVFMYGLSLTDPAPAAAIFSSNPIVISTVSILFLKESKRVQKILGIIIGFIGVFIIITEFKISGFFEQTNQLGNLLVFIGDVLWSIGIVIGKACMNKSEDLKKTTGMENFDLAGISFFISTFLMIPVVYIEREFSLILTFNWQTWIGVLFLGIFSTGVAYLFFYKGLSMVEASVGINLFYIKPVITTILGFFIFQAIPHYSFFIGLVLEFIGLFLVTSKMKIRRRNDV